MIHRKRAKIAYQITDYLIIQIVKQLRAENIILRFL